jgi:roadblock/LC7 domain-containing protein
MLLPDWQSGLEPRRKARRVCHGQKGAEYDGIDGLTFSPDGKRIAYGAYIGKGINKPQSVVVDGQAGSLCRIVPDSLVFSPDSKHVAYASEDDSGQRSLFVDGRRVVAEGGDGKAPSSLLPFFNPVFSADGTRFAYVAKDDKKWSVVLDGHAGPEYDQIYRVIFSPDGKRLAYAAKKGKEWVVVVDGQEGAAYQSIGIGSPVFSPDSKRIAYGAWKDKRWVLLVDGQEKAENYSIYYPTFSPDGKQLAYVAQTRADTLPVFMHTDVGLKFANKAYDPGGKWAVVMDGQAGKEYDFVLGATLPAPRTPPSGLLVTSLKTYGGAPIFFGPDGAVEFLAVEKGSFRSGSLYRVRYIPTK